MVVELIKVLWRSVGGGTRPLTLYPDDVAALIEYQERNDRLRKPHPCEGEAGRACSCFFLRKFDGQPEAFYVDTETQEIISLAFFASYRGQIEFYPNMEIGR